MPPGRPVRSGAQRLYAAHRYARCTCARQSGHRGQAGPAPAHTGFTQRLDPAPAQPAHSGYTQNLNQQASAAPDTASFVDGIAAAINTQQPAGDTRDYDSAAARLTDSLADDPAATRTRARIPTAAEVKRPLPA